VVDAKGPTSAATNFHFGQVDCAANGDLCAAEGVKYYPSLFLYVNGTIFDQYEGARKLDPLIKYVEANTPGDVEWAPEEATADGSSTVGTGTTVRDEESVTSDERVLGSEGQVLRVVEAPDSPSLPPVTPPPTVPGSLRKQVNPEEKKRRTSSKGVSPDGTVHVLAGTAVHGIKAEGNAPAFVKYYAPW
jgi:protein disulfide-isomerase